MGIQDDIIAERRRRQQKRPQQTAPQYNTASRRLDPIILLLEDFRMWAITNRVRSDALFDLGRGWLLEQWHEPAKNDEWYGTTHMFFVPRRGDISYRKSRESEFDYIYGLVVNYVARYNYPWPNNNSADDYLKRAVVRL